MSLVRRVGSAGALTVAVLVLAGCGSSEGGGAVRAGATSSATPGAGSAGVTATLSAPAPPASPTSPSPSTPPVPAVREIAVTIVSGKITPAQGRVEVDQGTTVRITVTSDQADEIHVHGYDREVPIGPGQPGTLEFVADLTGLFEVETHKSAKLLFQLAVR